MATTFHGKDEGLWKEVNITRIYTPTTCFRVSIDKAKAQIQTWNTRAKQMIFCTNVDPSTTKEGTFYSDLCRRFPTTSSKGKNTSTSCMYMIVIPS